MTVHQRSVVLGLALVTATLTIAPFASTQEPQDRLRPDEYDAVAVIYNGEIAALGERALYPICISTPPGTSRRSVVKYLRRFGYVISDDSICDPPPSRGDYPHGLRIDILKLQRGQGEKLDLQVASGDNTIHVGVHFAEALRKGTYHLKRNQGGQWEIVAYTKEFDYRDAKEERRGCTPSEPPSPPEK